MIYMYIYMLCSFLSISEQQESKHVTVSWYAHSGQVSHSVVVTAVHVLPSPYQLSHNPSARQR